MNKVDLLSVLMKEHELDLLVVGETWLIPEVGSSFVMIHGYDVVRGDTDTGMRKHGVCIYVKKDINYVQDVFVCPNVVAVHLVALDVWVLGVYRPPSYGADSNEQLLRIVSDFCVGREVVILGDFNLPTLTWPTESVFNSYVSPVDRSFFDCFVAGGLIQWIGESTFYPSGNILDLFLTSESDRVGAVSFLAPLPGCGHSPIVCDYLFREIHTAVGGTSRRLWFRGCYESISRSLSDVDWGVELAYLPVEDCYSKLVRIISQLVERFIPMQTGDRPPPWSTRPPHRLKVGRSRAWHHYRQCRSTLGRNDEHSVAALRVFLDINFQYRNFVRHSRAQYEQHLADKLADAPKLFHAYIRRKKVGCLSVGPLRLANGDLVDEPAEMCEVFADSFASVFVDVVPVNQAPGQVHAGRLDNFTITVGEVHGMLLALDSSSAVGPDGIHPNLLKSCASELAYPLSLIFNRSLESGVLPEAWLVSTIVPLFKGKSRYESLNYRPVSLTSVCCKTMERILVSHLVEYLEDNELLSPNQFGFRRGRSTEDQLLLTYADVVEWVDAGLMVDVVLLDFSKAFDVVCHSVLLSKLSSIGVDGRLLCWIRSFLRCRTFRVGLDGYLSEERDVLSGVPQGSVLGPVLFLIYVNHITDGIGASFRAFADDFKIYLSYQRDPQVEAHVARSNLQSDLNSVYTVSSSWNLKLNPSKCVVMRFCRGSWWQEGVEQSQYYLGDSLLPFVNSHRDLGVLVDTKLRFHLHVKQVVGKAAALANSLLRSTVCRSAEFMISLFVSHIRPILDYCSTLFHTGYVGDLRLLESVQRRWTKQVEGMSDLDYSARLRQLNLFSVKGRLLRSDLIKYWKILCVQEDGPDLSVMFQRAPDGRTRGHPYKLLCPRSSSDMKSRFFFARCVQLWNGLPSEVVLSSTLSSFKNSLVLFLGDMMFDYV
jgi:hypothetical protein